MVHNLSIFLDAAGWGALGGRILKQTRWLHRASGDEPFRLRGLWLEGRLQRGAGELVRAASCFEEARRGFLALEMSYDAALVSLELSLIFAETGLSFDLAQLANEMYPVFTALEVPREAAAALLLFAESARQRRATAAQVEQALRLLDPKTRVQPIGPA